VEEAQLQIADLILASPTKSKAYDGRWLTRVTCPAFRRAQSYSTELSGEVKDGAYHARVGAAGEPGSLVIDGKIVPDGTSALLAKGSVDSTAASGVLAVGTPYPLPRDCPIRALARNRQTRRGPTLQSDFREAVV